MNFFKEKFTKPKNELPYDIHGNELSQKPEGKLLQEIIHDYVLKNQLQNTLLGKKLLSLKLENEPEKAYMTLRHGLEEIKETNNGVDEKWFNLFKEIIYTTKNTGTIYLAVTRLAWLNYKEGKTWDEAAKLFENLLSDLLSAESGKLGEERCNPHFKIGTVKDFAITIHDKSMPIDRMTLTEQIASHIGTVGNPKSKDFIIKQTTELLAGFLKAHTEREDMNHNDYCYFFILMESFCKNLGQLKYDNVDDIKEVEEFLLKIEGTIEQLREYNSYIKNDWNSILRSSQEAREKLMNMKFMDTVRKTLKPSEIKQFG
ncbi:MAG: hypothetical protein WC662_01950 [Candidatus Paceibacterota bacterium]|jgi:hypothetical protein